MKEITKKDLKKYNDNDYVWYACYGSNINRDRFMLYINGDENEKYSTKEGCLDKTEPLEERKYIFQSPIYFAASSKRWHGGAAFLDYESKGKSYGKIYKIKMSQFRDVLEQEQKSGFYEVILLVNYIDGLPIFSFTAHKNMKDKLNQPSSSYTDVMKKGLSELFDDIDFDQYLRNN